jgi:hypothetical protein
MLDGRENGFENNINARFQEETIINGSHANVLSAVPAWLTTPG